jgi:ribonuclease HI
MENQNMKPIIDLYSDGGAEPNPGKGGYGLILVWNGKRKEFHQGYKYTTNNRMELLGVITGLEKLKTDSIVNIYTDSQYVINGIEKGWAKKWKSNNWYRNRNEIANNIDLWERLLDLVSKHKVGFTWIKGHNGHPENERCDCLATMAIKSGDLIIDEGFESGSESLSAIENEKMLSAPQNKLAIKNEGDLCRKCTTPVIKKIPKEKKKKTNQTYYFEYYLYCPKCKAMYMVEEAKKCIVMSE